jgi:hypothetical protein
VLSDIRRKPMNLLRKHAARLAVLFVSVALLLGVCACNHTTGSCFLAPAPGPGPGPAGAAAPLGGAGTFEILGGSTVTNTGATTTIVGDVGVSPGAAITGLPAGQPTGGTTHAADAVAAQAQTDLTTAYNNLAGRACNVTLSGVDLGGRTLSGGVYCFSTSAQLTGTLTLDGQGNAGAVFVFKIGSTLTTASNSAVVMTGGALARNVFWQVGSSATLGSDTAFQGNILALASITMNTGTSLIGRALARGGAVTMDTNAASLP